MMEVKALAKEYREYQNRRKQYHPSDPELDLTAFAQALERWDAEYDEAWKKEPPDFQTITELERLLAV